MKVIYSRWSTVRKRWENAPAIEVGAMGLVCAKEDHKDCMHGNDERGMKNFVFTSTVVLRNTMIQSILFTDKTVIVKLVPRNGAKA